MLPSLGRHWLLPLLRLLLLLELLLQAAAFNGCCHPQRPQQRSTQEPQPPHRPVAADKPLGSGSRARRPSSFDRREALRAGSALAIGLAVLGRTSGSSGLPGVASSAAQAAAAEAPASAIPAKGDEDILHDGSEAPSTSTLLGNAAAAPAAGAGAEAASSPLADFISGLAGGAASRASKELLLHPLDTIRVRTYAWDD